MFLVGNALRKGKSPWNKGKKLHYQVWMKGKSHSNESKIKQSAAKEGKVLSEEHKYNISLGNTGKKRSQEFCQKTSERMKNNKHTLGHKFSEERNKKISLAKKGLVLPHMLLKGKENPNYRPNALCRDPLYHKSKQLKRKAAGIMNRGIIQEVYELNIKKYGTLTCYLCLSPIEFGKDNIDHKFPISRGGVNSIDNLDIAHEFCNKSKGNKTLDEYKVFLAGRIL